MTWRELAAQNRIEPHATSKQELDDLRGAIERNLRDAAIAALSADNRFGLAYEAALLLAKMVLACSGYRSKGHGSHQATFAAIRLALGPSSADAASYFERSRRKRNELSYDMAGVVNDSEASEILAEANAFRTTVEDWIAKNHPHLS